MDDSSPRESVFKTPEGPAPKRRKLTEVEEGGVAAFAFSLDEPSSPSSCTEVRTDHPLHRSNSFSNLDRQDSGEIATEGSGTPILTPNSSPRHSCPSSPCESHHSSHHVHHAKLQILRPHTPTMSPVPGQTRRVGLVLFSKEQLAIIDSLPKSPQKCATIQALLEAYGLLEKIETIVPAMASAKDLASFHSEEFVEALRVSSTNLLMQSSNGSTNGLTSSSEPPSSDTESIELEEDLEIYGLKDDCSPFPHLWQYARLTAGATILAARYLIECDRQAHSSASPASSPRSLDPNTSNKLQHSSSSSSLLTSHSSTHMSEQETQINHSNPSIPPSSISPSSTPSNIDSPTNGTTFQAPLPPLSPLHQPQSVDSPSLVPPLSKSNSKISNGSAAASPAPVAIHWMGGRHHAKREEASGLCFVNDAVLGLLQLVNHFERVLYIDIDVHHGDGTEEAFKYSKQVLTLSCHLHDPGTFYPGSGAIDEIGEGKAKYYTINVPFKEGIIDASYTKLFDTIIGEAVGIYRPQAVVLVCGADCLIGDPLGGFNLSLHGVEHCIKTLLALNLPLLILGGGGYHLQNVSRLAAIVTAQCLSVSLPPQIPTHQNLVHTSFTDPSTYYSPEILKQNRNTEEYLKMLEATVIGNLQQIRS